MSCDTTDFELWQGKTFRRVLRWESEPYLYTAITAVTQAAPVAITAAGHAIPDGWRAAVLSAGGMRELNAKNMPPQDDDYHAATVVSSSVITFNKVNSAEFHAYTTGGYLAHLTPVDMTGYTARMMFKDRIGGDIILSLTSAAGITIDNTAKTITILITATQTAALDTASGVYELEMADAVGFVTPLLAGNWTLREEVTV